MTSARIQPVCSRHNIKKGCYGGFRVCTRKITERNLALFVLKKHLCLIRESQNISLIKAKKELKIDLKFREIVVSDKHVKNFLKNEYKP